MSMDDALELVRDIYGRNEPVGETECTCSSSPMPPCGFCTEGSSLGLDRKRNNDPTSGPIPIPPLNEVEVSRHLKVLHTWGGVEVVEVDDNDRELFLYVEAADIRGLITELERVADAEEGAHKALNAETRRTGLANLPPHHHRLRPFCQTDEDLGY